MTNFFSEFRSRLYLETGTLRTALVLTVLVSVAIPVGITSYLNHQRLTTLFANQWQTDLENTNQLFVASVREALWNLALEDAEAIIDAAFVDQRVFSIQLEDRVGKVFISKQREGKVAVLPESRVTKVLRNGKKIGTLTLVMDGDENRRQRDAALKQDFLQVLQPLLGALIIILVLLKIRLVLPIRRLVAAATALEKGNLTDPIDLGRRDEIGQLAHSMEATRKGLASLVTELELRVKQLEKAEALQRSGYEMVANIQKIAGMGIWQWYPETNLIFWSQAMYDIYRVTPKNPDGVPPGFVGSLTGIEAVNLVHPDDQKRYIEDVAENLEKGGKKVYQFRIIHDDQTIRTLYTEGNLVLDAEGNISHMFGFLQDITERQQAEQAILKLSLAVEQSAESIVITDLDARIEYVNETFLRTTGYTREELLGANPKILQSGQTSPDTYASMWSALTQEQPWEGEVCNRRKDGTVYFELVHITPIRQQDGRVTHYVGVKEDITEKKRIANELDQYRNNLEKLVDQRTSELTATNAALESTLTDLRTTQAQLIQSEKMASLGQLVANVAHEINTPISAVKASGGNIVDAMRHVLTDMPRLFQKLNRENLALFMQLINQANDSAYVLSTREERALVREASTQLEAEEIPNPRNIATILVQLNAHASLAEYLPLLRHPERELILKTANCIASIINNTRNINTAVDRVSKIVFALKSFSRVDNTGLKTEAQLSESLETVLTIYQSQMRQGTELVRHYENIPPLHCLPDELNQVWTNLIHNALQAMNHQGTLTIGIRQENDEAVVSISDSGCGIPEEIRSKIFDAFFTTKAAGEGSGLGLDIVKKIVDRHQGHITIQSEVGVGTTFSVHLPYTTTL